MLGFFDIFFAMGLVRIYGISNFMVIPEPNGMVLHAVVVYGLYVDFVWKSLWSYCAYLL